MDAFRLRFLRMIPRVFHTKKYNTLVGIPTTCMHLSLYMCLKDIPRKQKSKTVIDSSTVLLHTPLTSTIIYNDTNTKFPSFSLFFKIITRSVHTTMKIIIKYMYSFHIQNYSSLKKMNILFWKWWRYVCSSVGAIWIYVLLQRDAEKKQTTSQVTGKVHHKKKITREWVRLAHTLSFSEGKSLHCVFFVFQIGMYIVYLVYSM